MKEWQPTEVTMARTYKGLMLGALLGAAIATPQAVADEPACGIGSVSEGEVFSAERSLGTISDVQLESLTEHQILFVETWRLVVSGAVISSANPTIVPGLTVFLNGQPSPSSKVTSAVVEFVPASIKLKLPKYDPARNQIRYSVPVEQYEAFHNAITQCVPIYMQYRRYSDGHVFADLHIGAVPVGR